MHSDQSIGMALLAFFVLFPLAVTRWLASERTFMLTLGYVIAAAWAAWGVRSPAGQLDALCALPEGFLTSGRHFSYVMVLASIAALVSLPVLAYRRWRSASGTAVTSGA
jgi:hypothetical protein